MQPHRSLFTTQAARSASSSAISRKLDKCTCQDSLFSLKGLVHVYARHDQTLYLELEAAVSNQIDIDRIEGTLHM